MSGMKGSILVQKFDAKSGEKTFELGKDNMYFPDFYEKITGAYKSKMYGDFLSGLINLPMIDNGLVTYLSYVSDTPFDYLGAVTENKTFNRMLLSNNADEVVEGEFGIEKFVVAGATLRNAYAGSSTIRGTLNIAESYFSLRGRTIKYVVDFATNVANVTFQSVSLAAAREVLVSSVEGSTMDTTNAITEIQRTPAILDSNVKFPRALVNVYTYQWRFFDSPSAPAGWKLAVRTGGSGEGLKYCYANLATGEVTELQTLLNHVGSDFGATYNYEDFDVDGDYLYFCRNAAIGYGIYRWALNALSANAVELYVFDATTSSYYWKGGFAVVGTKLYSKGDSNTVNPVTGEPYHRHINVMNLADPSTIIDRISLTEILAQLGSVASVVAENYMSATNTSKFIKDSANDRLLLTMLSQYTSSFSSSLTVGRMVAIGISTVDDAIEFTVSDARTSTVPTRSYYPNLTGIDGNIYFLYESSVDFAPALKFEMIAKQTRVLLPAPVTKLPTETMKITYTLTIPDEILPLLGYMQTL